MHNTRQKLLENFDEEVHEKLKVAKEQSETLLSLHKQRLHDISKKVLHKYADFEEGGFVLHTLPEGLEAATGRYTLSMNEDYGHRYRIGLPLAHYAIKQAQQLKTDSASITFHYTGIPKISVLELFISRSGWMMVKKITIESFETIDEVIISCLCDDGTVIEPEIARRLFSLEGKVEESLIPEAPESLIADLMNWL